MSTAWTNENLHDYLDDRLSSTERAELETIIRKDAVAIEALRELRRLRAGLRKAPRFKLKQDFAARVVAGLNVAGLKQADDQSPVELINTKSDTDSVSELTTRASSQSLSASTWRTIAITMTGIAASLLLILIIRPDLSARDDLGQLTRTPGAGIVFNTDNQANGDNAKNAANGAKMADESAPGSDGPESKDKSDLVNKGTDDQPLEFGSLSTATDMEKAGESTPAPGLPSPEIADNSGSEGSSEFVVAEQSTEPGARNEIANADIKDGKAVAKDEITDDPSPFQFDEMVFVSTTRNHLDTMISVLNENLNDQALVVDNSALDQALKMRAQKGLEGNSDTEDAGDQPDSVSVVPHTNIDANLSTVVMSVNATPEQLDDFLAQIGAPSSRIIEPLPSQNVSIKDLLSRTPPIPDHSAGGGAGMSSGSGVPEKESTDLIAITRLNADVLSQVQPDLKRARPKPAPSENVDAPSTPPVVRRYLIVLETAEPPISESGK